MTNSFEDGNNSGFSNNPFLPIYNNNNYPASTGSGSGSVVSDISGDPEGEAKRRRERNRVAARKSRQRKLDRINDLEQEKMNLERSRDRMMEEIRSLETANLNSAAVVSGLPMSDQQYEYYQATRMQIIRDIEYAYNSEDILSVLPHFREDTVVTGPQSPSVHLKGQDAFLMDYLCTKHLYRDIELCHTKIESGGPKSQHFRVQWRFSGTVQNIGECVGQQFSPLLEQVLGKRVHMEGVSNYSFCGEKIVYVDRIVDQARFLTALVSISRQ